MHALLLLLVLFGSVARASAAPIVACGQQIPAGGVGVLEADLTCAGAFATSALVLGQNARLDLNGHTVAVTHPDGAVGIVCSRSCSVIGPGTISGAGNPDYGAAILSDRGRLTLTDVEISGFSTGVMQFPSGRLVATNLDVHDCSGTGVVSGRLLARQVSVRRNGAGIKVMRGLKGIDIEATDNRLGIQSARGVSGVGFTITANAFAGIVAGRVKLADSIIQGNGTIDIASDFEPELVNTICDHSFEFSSGDSWGVCTLD